MLFLEPHLGGVEIGLPSKGTCRPEQHCASQDNSGVVKMYNAIHSIPPARLTHVGTYPRMSTVGSSAGISTTRLFCPSAPTPFYPALPEWSLPTPSIYTHKHKPAHPHVGTYPRMSTVGSSAGISTTRLFCPSAPTPFHPALPEWSLPTPSIYTHKHKPAHPPAVFTPQPNPTLCSTPPCHS